MGELLTKDSKLDDYTEVEPKSAIMEPEPEVIAPELPEVVPTEEETEPHIPTAKERAKAAIEEMNQPAPRPKFDSTTPDYLKRTAKLGALSKGFSALGDVLSLSQGGNVNKPKKDTETGKYIDNYFGYLDKYKKQNDEYAYMDWQNQQRVSQIKLNEANREIQREESARRYQAGVDYRTDRDTALDKRHKTEYEAAQEWQKGALARQIAEIKARGDAYYKNRSTATDKEKKHQIISSKGVRRGYDDAEYSVLRKEALANIDEFQDIAPSLFDEEKIVDGTGNIKIVYTPKKTTSDDDIIRAYIDHAEKEASKKPTPTVAEGKAERERVLGEVNTAPAKKAAVADPFDF